MEVDDGALCQAVQALRAHASYIGDLDADAFLRTRAYEAGKSLGYELAVNFRAIDL
jgi:hypothetical protein